MIHSLPALSIGWRFGGACASSIARDEALLEERFVPRGGHEASLDFSD
jgi:hypothetical protein